jgi:transcriptional regulator with XRE-family HTH domain
MKKERLACGWSLVELAQRMGVDAAHLGTVESGKRLQLGEIEGRLRQCIEKVFSIDEIREGARQRRLKSVRDMTFVQYRDLLNDEGRWLQDQEQRQLAACLRFMRYLDPQA